MCYLKDDTNAHSGQSMDLLDLTANDFYQDEDGTFIAVDYDMEDINLLSIYDDDYDESEDKDDEMIIIDDYHNYSEHQTDDKFIVAVDDRYTDDMDFEDLQNERSMVYLFNAYSNNVTFDIDCIYNPQTPLNLNQNEMELIDIDTITFRHCTSRSTPNCTHHHHRSRLEMCMETYTNTNTKAENKQIDHEGGTRST